MAPPRSFDWEEARRLHASGLTVAEVARRMGLKDSQARVACMSDEVRLRRQADASAYVRARRGEGLNYDYDDCPLCGALKDRRSSRCGSCRQDAADRKADELERERDRRQAGGEELYREVVALRARGMPLRHIARATGVAKSTVQRWVTLGRPPRFVSPGPLRW